MNLKFNLDENLPDLVRQSRRAIGLDAHTVAEEQLAGAPDEQVFEACIAEDRIQVRLDLDFSDFRAYPPGSYPAIWVLRPPKQTFKAIDALVLSGLRLAKVERVPG